MQVVIDRAPVAELKLDHEEGEGWIIASDDLPYDEYESLLSEAQLRGFELLEGDEAITPIEFDDGRPGVCVWLYRPGA